MVSCEREREKERERERERERGRQGIRERGMEREGESLTHILTWEDFLNSVT